MSQYFIDDKNVSDTGDYTHIMCLAFLTFGNIYIEDALQSLRLTHAPRVIRLIRLAVFFIDSFRTVLAAL